MNRSRFMKEGKVDPSAVFGNEGVYGMHEAVTSRKVREPLMGMGASANPVLAAAMMRDMGPRGR
ncbi:MAG: hypothetical protein EYC62_02155 [Alphaproteobacteria bacterium]|nr:MAG: hypothetical protein EYC62_02155 [Alphaproteobacteria bacterium]